MALNFVEPRRALLCALFACAACLAAPVVLADSAVSRLSPSPGSVRASEKVNEEMEDWSQRISAQDMYRLSPLRFLIGEDHFGASDDDDVGARQLGSSDDDEEEDEESAWNESDNASDQWGDEWEDEGDDNETYVNKSMDGVTATTTSTTTATTTTTTLDRSRSTQIKFTVRMTVSSPDRFVVDPLVNLGLRRGMARLSGAEESWIEVELSRVPDEGRRLQAADMGVVDAAFTIWVPEGAFFDVAALEALDLATLTMVLLEEVNRAVLEGGGTPYDLTVDSITDIEVIEPPSNSTSTSRVVYKDVEDDDDGIGVVLALVFVTIGGLIAICLGIFIIKQLEKHFYRREPASTAEAPDGEVPQGKREAWGGETTKAQVKPVPEEIQSLRSAAAVPRGVRFEGDTTSAPPPATEAVPETADFSATSTAGGASPKQNDSDELPGFVAEPPPLPTASPKAAVEEEEPAAKSVPEVEVVSARSQLKSLPVSSPRGNEAAEDADASAETIQGAANTGSAPSGMQVAQPPPSMAQLRPPTPPQEDEDLEVPEFDDFPDMPLDDEVQEQWC